MMKCPICGNEINDNAKFCPHCGSRTDHSTEKKNIETAQGKV